MVLEAGLDGSQRKCQKQIGQALNSFGTPPSTIGSLPIGGSEIAPYLVGRCARSTWALVHRAIDPGTRKTRPCAVMSPRSTTSRSSQASHDCCFVILSCSMPVRSTSASQGAGNAKASSMSWITHATKRTVGPFQLTIQSSPRVSNSDETAGRSRRPPAPFHGRQID